MSLAKEEKTHRSEVRSAGPAVLEFGWARPVFLCLGGDAYTAVGLDWPVQQRVSHFYLRLVKEKWLSPDSHTAPPLAM